MGKLSTCVVSFIQNDGTRDFLDEGFHPLFAGPCLNLSKYVLKLQNK
jgi:hypothetical protein